METSDTQPAVGNVGIKELLVALASIVLVVGGLGVVAALDDGSGGSNVVADAPAGEASGRAATLATSSSDDDHGDEHGSNDGSADAHTDHADRALGATGAVHDHDGTDDAGHGDDADAGHAHDAAAPAAGHDSHPNDSAGPPGEGGEQHAGGTDHAHPPAGATAPTGAAPHGHGGSSSDPAGDPGGTDTTAPDGHAHEEPTGPIISLDDPRLTDAQRAAAQNLIDITTYGMLRFPTVESVADAGYSWIGDGAGSGYEHWVNFSYLTDGRELDPSRIESVVLERMPDGTKRIASAMYILEFGKTMDEVPEIAGELTTWHDHRNLCWGGNPLRIVGLAVDGVCERGVLIITPPMIHVWMVPHPCGPFAGIEGHEHESECGHSH